MNLFFSKIKNEIIGDIDVPFEKKFFYLITLIASISFFIITFFNYILELEKTLTIGTFLYSIIFFVLYFLAKKKFHIETLKFSFALIGISNFTFLWISNGGIDGGATYILFILISAYIVILSKRKSIFIITLSLITVGILIYIDFYFPNLITRYKTLEDKYFDVSISIFFGILTISFANYFIYHNYKLINKKNSVINSRLNKNLLRIQNDLQLANKIQQTILSKREGVFGDLEYYVKYQPIGEVGGDIFQIDTAPNENPRFFIADATGHGVQAALIIMLIFSEYQVLKTKLFSPNEILSELNKALFTKYSNLRFYFSCAILEIDMKKEKINFASAGHLSQYILKENKTRIELKRTGNLLGLYQESKFELFQTDFNKNDLLILFTDGLSDEFAKVKKQFSIEEILALVEKNINKNIKEEFNKIFDKIYSKNILSTVKDDITVIIAKWKSIP